MGDFHFKKPPIGGISGEFCHQIPHFFIVCIPHGVLQDNLSSMSVIQSFMLPSVSKTSINYRRLRYQWRIGRRYRNRHIICHYRALLQFVYLILRGAADDAILYRSGGFLCRWGHAVHWMDRTQLNKPKRRPRWAVSVTGSRRSPDDGREKRSWNNAI